MGQKGGRKGGKRLEANLPRMRSCRIGKLSGLGLCLEALVNTISLGRKMILTLHNGELVLSFKDSKLDSCVFKARLSLNRLSYYEAEEGGGEESE